MASSVMTSSVIAPSSMRGASIASSSSRVASFQVPAPVRMTQRRNVAVRASASENAQPRRAFLATLAALSVGAGAAMADQGRKEVRDKANDLLKAADDLTNNDSPPRYGGERGEDQSQSDRGAARGGGDSRLQAKAGVFREGDNPAGGSASGSDIATRAADAVKDAIKK